MDKQLLKTMLVTLAVVFAYNYFFVKPQLEEAERAASVPATHDSAPVAVAADTAPVAAALPAAAADSAALPPAAPVTRRLRTPETVLQWENRNGGTITALHLLQFRDGRNADTLNLVPDAARSVALQAWFGGPAAAAHTDTAADTAVMALTSVPGLPLTVATELVPDGPYRYRVTWRLHNLSGEPLDLAAVRYTEEGNTAVRGAFSVRWGPHFGDSIPDPSGLNRPSAAWRRNGSVETIGGAGATGGFMSCSRTPDNVETVTEGADGISWMALADRYFVVALVPDSVAGGVRVIERGHDLTAEFVFPELRLDPHAEQVFTAQLYAGPKDHDMLAAVAPQLEETMQFGWFSALGHLMLWIMKLCYAVIPNFGIAIILLTLLVRIVMYPLTYKSYQSMQQMQALQPKMQELRAKYPNNPEKQQQEIMKLYQQEKINPLGGCLPVLLQLPIFIALFQMLQYSIELRQAPFFGWITDLSQPDTVVVIGGFALNLLPFVMAATMFVQQKLSMTGLNPQQEKIMLFMPVMLLFMLYSFPSGLMLYWSLSNVVGVVQQKYLTRHKRAAALPPPAAKAKR